MYNKDDGYSLRLWSEPPFWETRTIIGPKCNLAFLRLCFINQISTDIHTESLKLSALNVTPRYAYSGTVGKLKYKSILFPTPYYMAIGAQHYAPAALPS